MTKQLLLDLEKPRRDHPIGSHVRADNMNADNKKKLSERAIEVLKLVAEYPGRTAAELGKIMSKDNPAKYEWPHKIMKRLVDAELVYRKCDLNSNRKEMVCWLDNKGVIFLNGEKWTPYLISEL